MFLIITPYVVLSDVAEQFDNIFITRFSLDILNFAVVYQLSQFVNADSAVFAHLLYSLQHRHDFNCRSEQWIFCPVCGNKTRSKIRADTILINYPLYSPKCKQERLITVKDFTITS